MREKKDFLQYMAILAYNVISKEVENCVFDTTTFFETHVYCINNPY